MARNKGQRQEQVLADLERYGSITLNEMMERYGCSEATARRDLDELERAGRVIRTMGGGAQYAGSSGIREVPFREKQRDLLREKEAIAAKAASLVYPGDVVGLTGGTTTYLIAKELRKREGITVVTNAVNIAMELADCEGLQVVLTGGVVRSKSYELCGPLAEQTVKALNIHKMFMGIDGISERGVSTYSELEANIAALLMERAELTIAVFDQTKIGRSSLFHVALLSELTGCITDKLPAGPLAKALAEAKVTVHLAGASSASSVSSASGASVASVAPGEADGQGKGRKP